MSFQILHSITIGGSSWEGFVIENLITAAGDRRISYFYRTEDGAEIDLLFEGGRQTGNCHRDQAIVRADIVSRFPRCA
jgi:hypothetical protein